MKKIALLLVLALSSTAAFSQSKTAVSREKSSIAQNKPAISREKKGGAAIPGIDIVVKKPAIAPATNKDRDPLIARINELENTYKKELAKEWEKNQDLYIKQGEKRGEKITQKSFLENGMGKVQRGFKDNFYRIAGHQEMKSKSVWNAYGDFLKDRIEIYTNDMEAAGITGKWFDEYFNVGDRYRRQ